MIFIQSDRDNFDMARECVIYSKNNSGQKNETEYCSTRQDRSESDTKKLAYAHDMSTLVAMLSLQIILSFHIKISDQENHSKCSVCRN